MATVKSRVAQTLSRITARSARITVRTRSALTQMVSTRITAWRRNRLRRRRLLRLLSQLLRRQPVSDLMVMYAALPRLVLRLLRLLRYRRSPTHREYVPRSHLRE